MTDWAAEAVTRGDLYGCASVLMVAMYAAYMAIRRDLYLFQRDIHDSFIRVHESIMVLAKHADEQAPIPHNTTDKP